MLVSEDQDQLRWHLIGFYHEVKFQKENYPEKSVEEIANKYIENELSMEEGMKAWADYENEICRHNARLLKAVKKVKGKTFYKYLSEIIEDSDKITGKMEIVTIPTGEFQKEKYGRQIKGIYVQQWGVGMEGDSWEGNVCVELKPNKFLKFSYSM